MKQKEHTAHFLEMLDYLCCPVCRSELKPGDNTSGESLICTGCNAEYEIKDEIPLLVAS